MQKLNIQFKVNPKNQSIFIGEGILKNIESLFNLKGFSKVVIITDRHIAKLFLGKIRKSLPLKTESIILPAGEKEKNIITVQEIWTKLSEFQCDRKTLVVNLGGGVICDVGGFAASTFMRGLDFINIPTTLLSQVDASVGGKTAINFLGIKNLIGTFQQPVGIVIDIQTLTTLPKREFISGFAEIIKLGLIRNNKLFTLVTSKNPLEFNSQELMKIIVQSIKMKAKIIEHDQTEKKLRKILNFGHTIGHAIEALSLKSQRPLLHGEAVFFGMLAEAKISNLSGLMSDKDFRLVQKKISQIELPSIDHFSNFESILEKIQSDKKNLNGKTNWTLLHGFGHAVIDQNVETSIIKKALKNYLL